ncbi:MAG: hypothetical protein H0T66_11800 [Geodermatophilaceae bacterium]|nr:hypothetical protein [Geodermatophilaceae bacterium]MDQ3457529.1 hypothetical protein [Actinomycetota bacterium]
MSGPDEPGGEVPADTPDRPEWSADTVEDAVDVAAEGSQHGGAQRSPEDAHPHEAPVEQVRNDPSMAADDADS